MSTELTELARRLNLSEDDPLLLVARGNAKLEGKVELWSTTIVQVLDLVRVQQEPAIKAAEMSGKLSDSLNQFDQGLNEFKEQMSGQNQILRRLTPAATELNQIKQSLKDLKDNQSQESNKVLQSVQTSQSVNRRWLPFLTAGLVVLVLSQLAQFAIYQSQLTYLRERSEWALTKLDRLEKQSK